MNYGWLSLLPPIVAVVMAIRSRNVILSLFCGGFVGTMIFCTGNPFLAVKSMIGDYFFVQLTDSYNAGVIVLVIFIGGFIKLMEKSGGAQAFSKFVYRFVNTKLKAQMCAWAGGILIFFSDLGTPLLVGPVFRPLFDKLKISREKLAWILDSTSSPVAILVPFIGWGVYIMGLIQAEFQNLGVTRSDYTTFVEAIPFQIYAILAILMIPLVAFTRKDFSQMRKAEKLAEREAYYGEEEEQEEDEDMGDYSVKNARPSMVLLPILVVFVTLFATLAPLGFPFQKVDGNEFRVALTMGYFFGALVLMFLIRMYKVQVFQKTFQIYVYGMKGMTDVAVTLVLAWSLGSMISGLGTADFIRKCHENRQFLTGTDSCHHLSVRNFCIVFHRKFLGNLRHHDAAGDSHGACICDSLRNRGGCGTLGRPLRRPLFADLGYNDPVLHRRTVRSGGTCEDAASLCGYQRRHRLCSISLCRIYRKSAGCGAGGGGAGSRDLYME